MKTRKISSSSISTACAVCSLILACAGCVSPSANSARTSTASAETKPSAIAQITSTPVQKRTATPSITPDQGPEPIPTTTAQMTPSPQSETASELEVAWNEIASLPAGNLILYESEDGLYAVTEDGSRAELLIEGNDLAFGTNSADGTKIFVYGSGANRWVVDLRAKQVISIPQITSLPGGYACLDERIPGHNISPDSQWIALVCGLPFQPSRIVFKSLLDDRIFFAENILDSSGREETFASWSWSPDSHWLAYYRSNTTTFSNLPETAEIMLIDTSCLDSKSGCPLARVGPYLNPKQPIWGMAAFAWSPDSQSFATTKWLSGFPLTVFDVNNKEISYIDAGENIGTYCLAWSPNGEWMAYSDGSGIHLVPTAGGKPVQVLAAKSPDDYVIGWLSLPGNGE